MSTRYVVTPEPTAGIQRKSDVQSDPDVIQDVSSVLPAKPRITSPDLEENTTEGGRSGEEAPSRRPYSFSYNVISENGAQITRKEESDGHGRIVGFYTIQDSDGRNRIVHYVADEKGFRAQVHTNEQGTESHKPAFVDVHTVNRLA